VQKNFKVCLNDGRVQQELLLILSISVLGPIIGSFIGVIKKPSERFMYNMLAFAGGVMLSISFLQLIPASIKLSSIFICVIGIIIGTLIMFFLDKLIPHIHPELSCQEHGRNLKRTSIFLIFGIFLHNIPEGMAIVLGSATAVQASLVIAIAISVHNIPEGICTSAPYYHETKNRLKAFLLSSTTAIPIIMGFSIAYVLRNFISTTMIGLIVGATAGFMIYITADEIIPTSCGENTSHKTIISLIIGILFVIILQAI
jgi:ZIP family zinc transporter